MNQQPYPDQPRERWTAGRPPSDGDGPESDPPEWSDNEPPFDNDPQPDTWSPGDKPGGGVEYGINLDGDKDDERTQDRKLPE